MHHIALSIAVALLLSQCGAHKAKEIILPGTPSGSYTITVSGNVGTATRIVGLNLTVQ
jgi:hypothetical protein